jgi:hypothetical protein
MGPSSMKEDAVRYHSQRATQELDLGLTAGSSPVARAHLQLASMHMQRVRELTGTQSIPMVMGL